MKKYTHIIFTFSCILLMSTTLFSQQVEKQWLNNALKACKKKDATHYMIVGDVIEDTYPIQLYRKDQTLKMEGHTTAQNAAVFHGEVVYYHPNGKVETKGRYILGEKVGLWERWDANGTPRAERTYASFDHTKMAYTYVDRMPVFEGGEEKFKDFLKHRIATCVSESRANERDLQISFIISEKGTIEDMKMTDGNEEIASEQLSKAFETLPSWNPGSQQGRTVRVLMTMPIKL